MAEIQEPRFLWINHAGYVLSYGEVVLAVDPWLQGSAFNKGWAHLSRTRFRPEDFGSVTHIWISHEHPDHFSPPSLNSIPEGIRRRITILYQKTRDRRVARYCEKLGFKVLELVPGARVGLGPSVSAVCGTISSDSWLAVSAGNRRILNLNDCVLRSEAAIRRIRDLVGAPDVLLTQFSYANWAGNPGDAQSMRRCADEKLQELTAQVGELRPTWVIPFASFIRFAHEENAYLNEHANRVSDVVPLIRSLGCDPVVLYPGDEWTVGARHDTARALDKYAADSAEPPVLASAKPVPLPELEQASRDFQRRMRERNWLWTLRPLAWLGFLSPVNVYVTDIDTTVRLDMFSELRVVGRGPEGAALDMSGDSLMFMLKNDFGIDSLLINGRFRERRPGARLLLSRLFGVARHNNDGFSYPAKLFDLSYLRSRLGA